MAGIIPPDTGHFSHQINKLGVAYWFIKLSLSLYIYIHIKKNIINDNQVSRYMTTCFLIPSSTFRTVCFFQHRHRDTPQLPLRHQGVTTLPQRQLRCSEQRGRAAPVLSTQGLEGGVEADGIAGIAGIAWLKGFQGAGGIRRCRKLCSLITPIISVYGISLYYIYIVSGSYKATHNLTGGTSCE